MGEPEFHDFDEEALIEEEEAKEKTKVYRENLPDCCREELNWTEYRDHPEIVNGKPLQVIMKSSNIYECASCKRILGSCSFGHDYAFPILIFLDKGRKGMIALCKECFNKLGFDLKLR